MASEDPFGGPSRMPASPTRNPVSPTRESGRGRSLSEALPPPRRAATGDVGILSSERERESTRRRSRTSRRSGGGGIPSLAPRTTLAERTKGQFTTGGPDDGRQLREAHEAFVHPAYAELNPSYEQSSNTKPVWSLAKPLPRVVRPGMVPTRAELVESRMNAELPAENSQRLGLDVDPNELERGRIEKSANVKKMAAQVTDARIQRENNFLSTVLESGAGGRSSQDGGPSLRMSRTRTNSTTRRPRGYSHPILPPSDVLSIVEERAQESTAPSVASDGADSGDLAEQRRKPETIEEEDEETLESRREQLLREEEARLGHDDDDDDDDDDDELKDGGDVLGALGLDEAALPEDLHPLVEQMVEDEVHNNHTTWSVIRTHHREVLAEALAVFIQLLLGFSSDLSVTVAKAGNPNTTDWAWGFATMIGIYISGGVSGAHLNPSITIMLWFYRGFPKRKMPEYFAAQFIGAFCAGLAAYGIYYVSIQDYIHTTTTTGDPTQDIINSFVTSRRSPFVNAGTALFTELIGTMCLAVVILALGDDQNAPPGAGMNSLIIGLVITVLSMAFANQTGAALNPSRDFGPRLALLALGYTSKMFTDPYWFYGPWAGSLMGAILGGFLYDFMIFTGGESPVNYPLSRTQRSFQKSKLKWRRRLGLNKAEKMA